MKWDEIEGPIGEIEGWLTPEQPRYLYMKAMTLSNTATMVEIGSYKGKSTACLACACMGTDRRVIAIDNFQASSIIDLKSNLSKLGVLAYVTILPIDSRVAMQQLDTQNQDADLVFVDGSHRFTNAMADIAMAYEILRPGGWLLLHDVTEAFPDVELAWKIWASFLTDVEKCSTLRAGRKSFIPSDTP